MKGVEAPPIGGMVRAIVVVLVVLLFGWFLLAWAVIKRPIMALPAAALVGPVALVGSHDAQALMLWALIVLGVWRLVHKPSFDRLVGRRLRSQWMRWWVYELRWRNTMRLSGLGKRGWPREAVPKLRNVRSTPWSDRVLVQLLLGQCTEDFERAAPQLAHSFGARSCRVREDRPGRVRLDFATNDPLKEVVPALPIPAKVELQAVAIGRQEDGQVWRLPVRGTHILIAGATGAGKGSIVWSLIRGVAPEIRTGVVAVWAIDPKGGMELAPGRALFARFCGGDFEEMAELLEDAVTVMKDRAQRLAGVTRLHEPTVQEPLLLVVVDEVATLTAYQTDRALRNRIAHSLGLLLTQGRAVGVCVVAALQDPRKEVLGFRNLFPAKIGLRLDEPLQVDMVLGDGAREQGARCDRIPAGLPGVGYVRIDGVREPMRVRAAYVSDDDIATMAVDYAAPRPRLDGEQLFRAAERDVDAEVIDITRAGEQPESKGDGKRHAS